MDKLEDLHDSIRERFRIYLNDDVAFRKFIRTCNDRSKERGRLTYAQEEIWRSFVDSNPDLKVLSFEDILAIFYVCHIHLKPLHSVDIPIRKGLYCVTLTREYQNLLWEEAYYSLPFALDSSAWGEATHIKDDHCEDCVARRRQLEGRSQGQRAL